VRSQFRRSKTYERLSRHEIVRQFVKYAVVGVLNVAIFLTIFNVLRSMDVPVLGANAIAFVVTSVNSFLLNKFWSFRDHRREAFVRQYLVFVLFTIVGLALNTAVFRLLLIPLAQFDRLGENAAALGALPVSVIWNFTTYRRWTFKPSARPTSA
jgi:putative flippase GtrA